MVNKAYTENIEGEQPKIDDSWWAAIMAEAEKNLSASTPSTSGNASRRSGHQSGVNWERVKEIYEKDLTISLRVIDYNRGGLLVEGPGLQGFVPISHLVNISTDLSEDEREKFLASYIASCLQLKVIECDPARSRVVFSERAALSAPGRRMELLNSLKPGDLVCGTVTNITDFGVFVDLGGIEGLIHVSELSWGRVRHPSDVLAIGNRIEVYVINVDRERLRVALSVKRLHPNPWETVENRYRVGQIVDAVITSITSFGAFARLEEGLDGLIHISEMCLPQGTLKPAEIVSEGQIVRVRILHVDAVRQRLGLSMILNQPA